jgi:hypothetical protein
MSIATNDHVAPQVDSAASKPQRDAKGRFVRNNDGGPGNPFGRRVAELRKVLLRSATEENVERLANMLMEKAFAGDLAAAKLLLLYWIGKPKEVAEPDRQDVEEWELARQSVVRSDVAEETFGSMPITIGLAAMPGLNQVRELEAADMIRHPEKYAVDDDELTAEELAEEAEMLREMRAAREAEETGRPADLATEPATTGRATSARVAGDSRSSEPQANEAVVVASPAGAAAGACVGSPSPIGGAGRGARCQAPAANSPGGAAKRAG